MGLPFITALCPTFRHPELLANTLNLWNKQTYPATMRHLVILDDAGTFDSQNGFNWTLYSTEKRCETLPGKFNWMLKNSPPNSDAYLVIEDDNIYMSRYIESHAACLQLHEYSTPNIVYVHGGSLVVENCNGYFHSAIGFRKSLINKVGGWPNTKIASFDWMLMDSLRTNASSIGNPWPEDTLENPATTQFCLGWGETGAAHSSACITSPQDEDWYEKNNRIFTEVPYIGQLRAKEMKWTRDVLNEIGRE